MRVRIPLAALKRIFIMSQSSTASLKYEEMIRGRFYILQRALMKLDQKMDKPYRISAELDPSKDRILITAKSD